MKKNLMITAAAAAMTLALSIPAFAGEWKQDNTGWYYQYTDGTYARGGWKEIDGVRYNFDANGYMATGWKKVDGIWMYFNGDGSAARGWTFDGSHWYYMNDDGTMKVSFQKIKGANGKEYMYYFYDDPDADNYGQMAMNTVIQYQGTAIYFDTDGHQVENKAIDLPGLESKYKDGVLVWRSLSNKSEWIPYSTKDVLIEDLKQQLEELAISKKAFKTVKLFEKEVDARLGVGDRLDEGERAKFVSQVASEYRSTYSSSNWYYDTDYDDTEYDDYYDDY